MAADPVARICLIWFAVLLILALLGPVLPFGDTRTIAQGPRLSPPTSRWWFGTDDLGRPLLPRMLEGLRNTIALSSGAVALTTILAAALGSLTAYLGGFADRLTARLLDVVFSFPALILGLLVAALMGPGIPATIVTIVAITFPLMTRVVRSAAQSIVTRDFVVAAEVSGVPLWRILLIHVVPNVGGVLLVQATVSVSTAMLVESGLSYLGMGIQPPSSSLGSLVYLGSPYLHSDPTLALAPGFLLGSAIFAVNVIGDALRDLVDPRPIRGIE